ncbi:MAG: glycosyltransferase [Thermodesulfovibrionales bacterium]
MKTLLKGLALRFGVEIRRSLPDSGGPERVTLRPHGAERGRALLAYIMAPFLLREGEPLPVTHTHFGESLEIAAAFLRLGYAVDAIDYRNRTYAPDRDYSFFVSARTNFARIARLLNRDCIKVANLDTAHWLFNNGASYRRALSLQQRRGVTLGGVRIVEPNLAIEHADYATVLGNEFTLGTYAYARKPLFRTHVPACMVYPWPEGKDFASCGRSFLWLGSGGLVHKGLDLVLDVFAGMPDFTLYVCGPVGKERDFEKEYARELYATPNIHTVGWVSIDSPAFREITEKCAGILYPSCSEGQAGSVVTCMHEGLIPLVSYESGVDVEDFGILLRESSPDALREALHRIASLRPAEREERARKAWDYARKHHTRASFAEEYERIITGIQS